VFNAFGITALSFKILIGETSSGRLTPHLWKRNVRRRMHGEERRRRWRPPDFPNGTASYRIAGGPSIFHWRRAGVISDLPHGLSSGAFLDMASGVLD